MVPWGANLLQFSSSVSKCVRPPLQFNWTPRTLGILFWSLSSPSLLSCTTTPSLTQLHPMFPISCKENDRPVTTTLVINETMFPTTSQFCDPLHDDIDRVPLLPQITETSIETKSIQSPKHQTNLFNVT